MRSALVFNGANNLDFLDIRSNVLRIPEVISRIRESQTIIDQMRGLSFDLANFIASEDSIFLNQIRLKCFAAAVVQVGLLDRYLRNHSMPEYVIGAVNGDSPLNVAIGKVSFREMVMGTHCFGTIRNEAQPSGQRDLPILTGIQLQEYGVFRRNDEGVFELVTREGRDMERMILELVDSMEIKRLMIIGPGNSLFSRGWQTLIDREVEVLESIDLDPMLSWFWRHLRDSRLAVAN